LALVAAFAATSVPAADANQTGRQLRAALDEVMGAPEGPPGISVLIQRGRETQYLRRGKADLSTGARPTRGQRYRIASMAKAFNGAVALALVSRGRLELDDTIGELLPGVLRLAEDVTLAQLLQHTASLPDYIKDPDFIADLEADPTQYLTPLELVAYVAETEPEFDPGERYEYSDTDNVIVGLMAEAATGETYDQLLERLVYSRAGLKNTTLPVTIAMPAPYLHGYEVPIGAPPLDVSELINPALAWASGGIVSNAAEVGRFFRAYVGGDSSTPRPGGLSSA
jgi:D-alanyl-D-alanine carboxypeptidase